VMGRGGARVEFEGPLKRRFRAGPVPLEVQPDVAQSRFRLCRPGVELERPDGGPMLVYPRAQYASASPDQAAAKPGSRSTAVR